MAKKKGGDPPATTVESAPVNVDDRLLVTTYCGGCVHLNQEAHPSIKSLCKELGKTEESASCTYFNPDWTLFRDDKTVKTNVVMELLKTFRRFTKDFDAHHIGLYSYIVANTPRMAQRTERYLGYPLVPGELVMVNLGYPGNQEFLNCWV